ETVAQRDADVPRLKRPGGGLRKERLVRHVVLRVDDRDPGLVAAQLLLQPQRGVHPDVPAADDEEVRPVRHGPSLPSDSPAYRTSGSRAPDRLSSTGTRTAIT